MNLDQFQLSQDSSILDAMKMLTEHNNDVLVICDKFDNVVGLVTDGDLRRGLVSNGNLYAPIREIMSKDFISVSENTDRAFLLDMMMARKIRHLPILGKDKKLKGIHFLSHVIGHKKKPNIAVIMAGGKGMRLRPITEFCPKPMLKVAGRPILERLVLHLVSHGITKIYISINYMGKMIEDYFQSGAPHGCEIEYLKESEALGSGGALSLLPEKPKHPFVVMNGDLITDIDISSMLDFYDQKKAFACIASKKLYTKISYGVLEKQEDSLIRIIEKPTLQHEINVGTYILSPECIDLIKPDTSFPITDIFDVLKKKNKNVCVYEVLEDWIDIGQPHDLKKALGYDD